MFNREELDQLFVKQLVSLAEYRNVPVKSYWRKDKIIDKILEYQDRPKEEEPPMSVRVKRIKELNRS